ncbi:hypothetical protein B0H16DRAFT_1565881 [Mycena metata]|uniref:MYND-type domain-containing protein n=1 Tax=Mycena metata TaxID=1033252 RepID=A0AAD7IFF5_9AGAR|nr:hypothetical protein B0H16DRAFT_1565881 [Mycena metata]
MPSLSYAAGSNDLCYQCNKPGQPKLRTCSRCQVARYCSPECQKLAWKKHKPECIDHKAILKEHEDPTMDETLRWFLKWLNIWRDPLLAWAAFSANLANQPADYVLNHSCLVEVKRRPPAEAAKHATRSKYLVTLSGMCTDVQMHQEFNSRLTDPAYRAQIVENFHRVPPAPRVLRLVIVCFPLYSVASDDLWNIFPDNKSAAFSNPFSSESRLLSTALERAWKEQFAEHVKKGNITGHKEVLQKLIEESQILTRVALEVD